MASRRLQAVHEACSCSICCEPFTAEGAGKPIALPCSGAHSFCTQCVGRLRDKVCPECRDPLPGGPVRANVTVLRILDALAIDRDEKLYVCAVHTIEKDLFCLDCAELICSDCVIFGVHHGHRIERVSRLVGEELHKVQAGAGAVLDKLSEIDQKLQGATKVATELSCSEKGKQECMSAFLELYTASGLPGGPRPKDWPELKESFPQHAALIDSVVSAEQLMHDFKTLAEQAVALEKIRLENLSGQVCKVSQKLRSALTSGDTTTVLCLTAFIREQSLARFREEWATPRIAFESSVELLDACAEGCGDTATDNAPPSPCSISQEGDEGRTGKRTSKDEDVHKRTNSHESSDDVTIAALVVSTCDDTHGSEVETLFRSSLSPAPLATVSARSHTQSASAKSTKPATCDAPDTAPRDALLHAQGTKSRTLHAMGDDEDTKQALQHCGKRSIFTEDAVQECTKKKRAAHGQDADSSSATQQGCSSMSASSASTIPVVAVSWQMNDAMEAVVQKFITSNRLEGRMPLVCVEQLGTRPFNKPSAVAFDDDGALLIADCLNDCIQVCTLARETREHRLGRYYVATRDACKTARCPKVLTPTSLVVMPGGVTAVMTRVGVVCTLPPPSEVVSWMSPTAGLSTKGGVRQLAEMSVRAQFEEQPVLLAFDTAQDTVAVILKNTRPLDFPRRGKWGEHLREALRLSLTKDVSYVLQITSPDKLHRVILSQGFVPGGMAFNPHTGNFLVTKRSDECRNVEVVSIPCAGQRHQKRDKCRFNIKNNHTYAIAISRISFPGRVQDQAHLEFCPTGTCEENTKYKDWTHINLTPLHHAQSNSSAPSALTRLQIANDANSLTCYALAEPLIIKRGCSVGMCLNDVSIVFHPDSSRLNTFWEGSLARKCREEEVGGGKGGVVLTKADGSVGFAGLPVASVSYLPHDPRDAMKQCLVYSPQGLLVHSFAPYGHGKGGQVCNPTSVAVDRDGLVYVADTGNHRIQVYRHDTVSQTYSLLTSLGSVGSSIGQFLGPTGLALSMDNLLAVADCGNHRVQVFDLKALISTSIPLAVHDV